MSDLKNTGASPEMTRDLTAVISSCEESPHDAVGAPIAPPPTDMTAGESAGAAAVSPDVAQDAVPEDPGADVQNPADTEGDSAPADIQKPDPIAARLDVLVEKATAAEAESVALREKTDALQKAVTGFYTQTTDSMHKELEKFRKGLVRKLEQELFGELIDLYDATERAIAHVSEDPARAQALLEGIRDQIDAALFNHGVEKREATIGEKFDGRRHHLARPDVPTGDSALNGTVAATAKPGFDDMDDSFKDLRGGCMKLRPIHVRLYKFVPALAEPVEPVTPGQPAPQSAEPIPTPTTETEPESVAAPAETPSSEPEARS